MTVAKTPNRLELKNMSEVEGWGGVKAARKVPGSNAKRTNGSPISPRADFQIPADSACWRVVYGDRLQYRVCDFPKFRNPPITLTIGIDQYTDNWMHCRRQEDGQGDGDRKRHPAHKPDRRHT